MRRIFVSLLALVVVVMMGSCTQEEYLVDDDVIDMNWNSAVKDFYFPVNSDTSMMMVVKP